MDEQFIINYVGINATSIYHWIFAKAVHRLLCLSLSLWSRYWMLTQSLPVRLIQSGH